MFISEQSSIIVPSLNSAAIFSLLIPNFIGLISPYITFKGEKYCILVFTLISENHFYVKIRTGNFNHYSYSFILNFAIAPNFGPPLSEVNSNKQILKLCSVTNLILFEHVM